MRVTSFETPQGQFVSWLMGVWEHLPQDARALLTQELRSQKKPNHGYLGGEMFFASFSGQRAVTNILHFHLRVGRKELRKTRRKDLPKPRAMTNILPFQLRVGRK